MKNSLILYYDYATHFELLSDEQLGQLLRAIMKYEQGGVESEIDGMVKMAFSFIKKQLDADKIKYNEKCGSNKANGFKGGRPKTDDDSTVEKNRTVIGDEEKNRTVIEKTERLKNKPKKPDNDNDNDNVNVNVNDNDIIKEKYKKKADRFLAPTVSEVEGYCKERKNSVSAERFVNFYESKGWVVGKSPMRDWRACVRTWEEKEKEQVRQQSETKKYGDGRGQAGDDGRYRAKKSIEEVLNEVFDDG